LVTWTPSTPRAGSTCSSAPPPPSRRESDIQKYEKARKLKLSVDAIRKDYFKRMKTVGLYMLNAFDP
jgi:hypothetical protein